MEFEIIDLKLGIFYVFDPVPPWLDTQDAEDRLRRDLDYEYRMEYENRGRTRE